MGPKRRLFVLTGIVVGGLASMQWVAVRRTRSRRP